MDRSTPMSQADWLLALTKSQSKAAELFGRSEEEQRRLGYFHTLREICQQPWTWPRTCQVMLAVRGSFEKSLAGVRSLTLTGSGSSQYAAECVQFAMRNGAGLRTESVGGGDLLTFGGKVLPPDRPGLLISLARSGDSPESRGAMELLLDTEPEIRHIVLTCNEQGSLTKAWRDHAKVLVTTLPRETNDQSLVMTSSFTNLLLAARFMGMLTKPEEYERLCSGNEQYCQRSDREEFRCFGGNCEAKFRTGSISGNWIAFCGGAGSRIKDAGNDRRPGHHALRNISRLSPWPHELRARQNFIGLFLSSDSILRAYELDLLQELDRKNLGLSKLVVGENIPQRILRKQDVAVECPGLAAFGDEEAATIDVVVAQLLGFFRCLQEGLRPDSPSEDGIIQRVVESFPLHTPS
jgi:Predicted phosphosugar isomerases